LQLPVPVDAGRRVTCALGPSIPYRDPGSARTEASSGVRRAPRVVDPVLVAVRRRGSRPARAPARRPRRSPAPWAGAGRSVVDAVVGGPGQFCNVRRSTERSPGLADLSPPRTCDGTTGHRQGCPQVPPDRGCLLRMTSRGPRRATPTPCSRSARRQPGRVRSPVHVAHRAVTRVRADRGMARLSDWPAPHGQAAKGGCQWWMWSSRTS
jgi:hypothetical protein